MLLARLLDQGAGPSAITRAVRRQTGENPTIQCVTSYAAQYREAQTRRQEARQYTSVLLQEVERQGCEMSELLRAAFLEAFTELLKSGKAKDIRLLDWEAAERKRRELALKERHVEVAERRVKVFEERLRLDREKMQAALEKLDRKAEAGQPLSPEDVRRIREIYGLCDRWSETENGPAEEEDGGGIGEG